MWRECFKSRHMGAWNVVLRVTCLSWDLSACVGLLIFLCVFFYFLAGGVPLQRENGPV